MTTIHGDTVSIHPPPRSRVRQLLPRVLVLWTLAAFALVALAMGFMNFSDVGLIWSVPLECVLLVILCTGMMDLVYAVRWRIWLRLAEPEGRFGLCSLWTFVTWSRLASQILPVPAGSVGVRAAAIKTTTNLSIKQAACTVAVDPMLDLYQFLLIVPITAAMLMGYVAPARAAMCVMVSLCLGALLLATLFPTLVTLVGTLRRVVRMQDQASPGQEAALPSFTRGALLTAYALTVVRYVFVVARIWVIGFAIGVTGLSPMFCLTTGTVTQAAHMATITPGALGVLEGGWFAVLRAFDFAAHDATLFVTAQRLLIWLALAVIALVLTAVFVVAKRQAAAAGLAETEPGAADPSGATAS